MGGGVAVLVMTALVDGLALIVDVNQAWRWALFVPGSLQILVGVAVLLAGDDAPEGGGTARAGGGGAACAGPRPPDTLSGCAAAPAAPACCLRLPPAALNYRTYVLALAYALSFGVELTVDNVITYYFFDQFDLGLTASGLVASVYGLMNLFTRALGGLASDAAAARAGMRGRLWVLFGALLLGGVTCATVGLASASLAASISALVVFSVFTQAACGCVFGVVPFLSARSTGFAMGAVAAGGNAGSAATQVGGAGGRRRGGARGRRGGGEAALLRRAAFACRERGHAQQR
jgi:NNP family nitrate/nitrite transporter-like MFS transporter